MAISFLRNLEYLNFFYDKAETSINIPEFFKILLFIENFVD